MARRRGSGKTIDSVRWTGDVVTQMLAVSASAAVQQYAVGDQEVAPTILRTRGFLLLWMDAAVAAGEAMHLAIGLRTAPKGSGATVAITPISEAEADWFVWRSVTLAAESVATGGILNTSFYKMEIDSKAMRKMKPGQEIQLVLGYLNIVGGAAVNVAGQLRFLLGS